jgi:hypothetical protein
MQLEGHTSRNFGSVSSVTEQQIDVNCRFVSNCFMPTPFTSTEVCFEDVGSTISESFKPICNWAFVALYSLSILFMRVRGKLAEYFFHNKALHGHSRSPNSEQQCSMETWG